MNQLEHWQSGEETFYVAYAPDKRLLLNHHRFVDIKKPQIQRQT
jgi:hypothetical protein